MTKLSITEEQELAQLRKSAHKFLTDPLEKAFFELECLLDSPHSSKFDSVMSVQAVKVIAKALLELKREVKNNGTK